MNRILILGSGYISGCLINFLTRVCSTSNKYLVSVASIVSNELEDLAKRFPSLVSTTVLNIMEDSAKLSLLVKENDIIISLLPNHMHVPVAKVCMELRVNMLHASYNSEELNSLNSEAVDKGVLILGELGLDPGIDHLLAMKCIHEIQDDKGNITSFVSYCGGLPAPEWSRDNALRYKFSWAPKTALANLLNGAKFLENKEVVEIPSGGGILEVTKPMEFLSELNLEGYPNRDSLTYIDKYGLSPDIKTMLRGTLRYSGFAAAIKKLINLGLLSSEDDTSLDPEANGPDISWRTFIASRLLRCNRVPHDDPSCQDVLTPEEFETLSNLGLLSTNPINKLGTPLDTLAKHLEETLKFENGEQDVIILHHEVKANFAAEHGTSVGRKDEFREIDFIVYGDPINNLPGNTNTTTEITSYSAMAKTVSYTLGIAAEMILNGEIKKSGVILPLTKDIYLPILERLTHYGLFAIERISDK